MSATLLPLSPAFVPRPWGGQRLKSLKGMISSAKEVIGETWEVSLHPDGPSTYNGAPLSPSIKFDYLVKLIEAKENLSVQVHPDDAFASHYEGGWGKSECWLILDATEGAGIYLGFAPNVTAEYFKQMVHAGADLRPLLRFRPVKAGDFFYVPAGSVHAIGAGITLAEIQQSSGITYRVWDWNRVDNQGKARELHIDKAMQVLNFSADAQCDQYFGVRRHLFSHQLLAEQLIVHPQFSLMVCNWTERNEVEMPFLHQPDGNILRPAALICLEGKVQIKRGDEYIEVEAYRCALCLADGVKVYSDSGVKFLWVY